MRQKIWRSIDRWGWMDGMAHKSVFLPWYMHPAPGSMNLYSMERESAREKSRRNSNVKNGKSERKVTTNTNSNPKQTCHKIFAQQYKNIMHYSIIIYTLYITVLWPGAAGEGPLICVRACARARAAGKILRRCHVTSQCAVMR